MTMTGKTLRCVVLTPEREIFDGPADFVVIPLADGELGIAPGRRELLAELAPGELRIRQGDRVERFYIEDGVAEVIGDRVRILGRTILRPDEIDAEGAQAALDELARKKWQSPEELAARDAEMARLRTQIRVFRR